MRLSFSLFTPLLLLATTAAVAASDYDLNAEFAAMPVVKRAPTQCSNLPAQAMVIDSACTANACDKGAKNECLGKQKCGCCLSTVAVGMLLSTYAYCH